MGIFAGTPWDRPPHCDRCGELESDCKCPPPAPPPREFVPPQKQTPRLAIEKRQRGKKVTVVRGLQAKDNDLPALLTHLKTGCGAGGTIKDDEIEIQGEHLERVRTLLTELGYNTRQP